MKTCCLVQLANLGLEDSLTWLSFLKLGSWICRKGRRRSPFVKLITVIRQFPLLTHYLFIFQYLKCKKCSYVCYYCFLFCSDGGPKETEKDG